MHLLLLKYLAYAFIWGSIMHNGIMPILYSSYPIKCLNAHLLPHKSILDNILQCRIAYHCCIPFS